MRATAGRCAYCRRSLIELGAREADHVVPRSVAGGLSDDNDTVIACARCNRYKSNKTHAQDPVTLRIVPLFDPLRMQWEEHFKEVPGLTIGVTPIGRATGALLFQASPSFPVDPGYWPYREMTDDADAHFITIEGRRAYRENRWRDLDELIEDMWAHAVESEFSTRNYLIHIAYWLKGSEITKRALPNDILSRGWRNAALLLSQDRRMVRHFAECRVAAVDHWRNLQPPGALKDYATRVAGVQYQYLAERFPENYDVYRLRSVAILAPIEKVDLTNYDLESLSESAFARASNCDFAAIGLLQEIFASDKELAGMHTRIAGEIERMIPISGIGQGIDLVQESILKRASITAVALENGRVNESDVRALAIWAHKVEMQNEVAELAISLERIANRVSNARRMAAIVRAEQRREKRERN